MGNTNKRSGFVAKADDVEAIRSYFKQKSKEQDIQIPIITRDLNLPEENKKNIESKLKEMVSSLSKKPPHIHQCYF